MAVYYNDSDAFVCAWLRNLITGGLIPAGEVDERPIQAVSPDDVRGFTQCHFFAGIGGWAYAIQLAGWGDRPVWTGSCPCQPFSAAGKGQAADDPRHLWPHWFRLIRESRPRRVFGEQVAGAVRHGWLDLVSTDLEGEGYAVGACVLGAHSVGAPHLRQRLWFVADSTGDKCQGRFAAEPSARHPAGRTGTTRVLADTEPEHDGRRRAGAGRRTESPNGRDVGELADAEYAERRAQHEHRKDGCDGTDIRRTQTHGVAGTRSEVHSMADAPRSGRIARVTDTEAWQPDAPWRGAEWLPCRDGKARPVEPGLQPLAHGVPQRVGRLRAYGNAINPWTAAAFVRAYMGACP